MVAFRPPRAVPSMPNAPASQTAAASSGGEAAPMPACWIGTVHPISFVNRVVSIVAPFSSGAPVWGKTSDPDGRINEGRDYGLRRSAGVAKRVGSGGKSGRGERI